MSTDGRIAVRLRIHVCPLRVVASKLYSIYEYDSYSKRLCMGIIMYGVAMGSASGIKKDH